MKATVVNSTIYVVFLSVPALWSKITYVIPITQIMAATMWIKGAKIYQAKRNELRRVDSATTNNVLACDDRTDGEGETGVVKVIGTGVEVESTELNSETVLNSNVLY